MNIPDRFLVNALQFHCIAVKDDSSLMDGSAAALACVLGMAEQQLHGLVKVVIDDPEMDRLYYGSALFTRYKRMVKAGTGKESR
jgi:hypothetical protein